MLDTAFVKAGSQFGNPPDGSHTIDLPPSKQEWVLTQESFDGLLSWLDPDRERAGEKYEEVRSALNRRFHQLGSCDPDELTTETFNRVAKKLPQIVQLYQGDPVPYFFSVAHYVYMENRRRPIITSLASDADLPDTDASTPDELVSGLSDELLDSCLRHCLQKMTKSKRQMILKYYKGERDVKIKLRKELADNLGIKLTNLRLRAQRIRVDLKSCILNCLERSCADSGFARTLEANCQYTSESGEE